MSKPVTIHHVATSNVALRIETYRPAPSANSAGVLISQVDVAPGDTFTTTIEAGGAVVLSETPNHG